MYNERRLKFIHVNKITLNKNELLLEIGDQYSDLNATVYPSNATKPCVTWTSSNIEVAAVHRETGHILTTGVGTAIIYACACDSSKVYACCNVAVTPVRVKKLVISNTGLSMFVGENKPLTATVSPEDAADPSLNWTTSDSSIVTFANGRVYAKGEGRATITVSTNDDSELSRSCNVTVKEKIYVESIEFNHETEEVTVGYGIFLNKKVLPSNASCPCVKWFSKNPSIATVNPTSGLVVGLKAGSTAIIATACDGSGKTASCFVTVVDYVPVAGICINSSSLALDVGQTAKLDATILPSDATIKRTIWSSSNPDAVWVGSFSGKIHAKKPGRAIITVSSFEDSSITAQLEITVNNVVAPVMKSLYGRVKYGGQMYDIHVPNHIIHTVEQEQWTTIENVYKNKVEFDGWKFITGIDIPKFENADGMYIRGVLPGNKVSYTVNPGISVIQGGAYIVSALVSAFCESLENFFVSFEFQESNFGNKRVIIKAGSSDAQAAYNRYADNVSRSAYISNSGNGYAQACISQSVERLYEYYTEQKAGLFDTFDFEVTVDKLHKQDNGAASYLWIDYNGQLVETPMCILTIKLNSERE